MTAPADTIVYDSLTVAYWQGQPEYDYNRELITPEFDLIAWLNLWLGKLLQKIFGSTFAEKYTETILVALFVVALLLIVWFIYKKRPELFMRSKRTLPYRVEEDTIYGKIVVIEEVDEHEYFHDRRIMVSIFMSILNVHANWYPVDGTVKKVSHHNGKFMKAWLPKASTENERSTVVIETPEGVEILTRQIAGAMARRIVTYAEVGEECYIDEHMGFIKFGSRVDVYLPLGTEICVTMGQLTTGNQTVIAKLK